MPEYLSPGVYVEEVDTGPRPIEATNTSTAVFVGFTEKAEDVRVVDGETIVTDLTNRPTYITNWIQYSQKFGGLVDGAYLPLAIQGFFTNGGTKCYIVSLRQIPPAQAGLLNGSSEPALIARSRKSGLGGMDYRVRIAASANGGGGLADEEEENGDGLKPFDVIIEKRTNAGDWQVKDTRKEVRLEETEADGQRQVRVAYRSNKASELIDIVIPDQSRSLAELWPAEQQQSLSIEQKLLAAPTPSEFRGDVAERTGVEGLEVLDDARIICVPDLMTTMPGEKLDLKMVKAVQTSLVAHCERLGDRMAILDTPPNLNPQEVKAWRQDITGFDSAYAVMYYPWIEVMDMSTDRSIHMPPSGFMAGVWARTDNTRGVHKAPANEVVMGATGLAYNVTKGEQDVLNPIGVNCVRSFAGMGIRIWGARTLTSNALWRYVSVRRLFNMIETTIENSTQWTVFEPNDPRLWGKIRRDVGAFLTTQWNAGALYGASPSQAFYVKCDEQTNPPESRDLGRVVVEVGIAPVKPAEFVIFRISQWNPELSA
ncbi:MAG: phage tail sheath subtilisin-like domain-containing protein [Caldilineaceae bacterium]|nr:phage tail sheath subtilisin-like domain-containing protein [Caldilineaceae bacterium]HRJ41992.1 phage tail sheath subtilisin-like domain-containing protein [Caldilineaceae bacterium]